MSAARPFDAFLIVDWSANTTPKRGKDSIWWHLHREDRPPQTSNPATRDEAMRELEQALSALLTERASVLLGFDFSFGYPRGFAQALGLAGTPWSAVWTALKDAIVDAQARGETNRYQVAAALNARLGDGAPFWGHAPGRKLEGLEPTKPLRAALPRLRLAEACTRGAMSTWQLHYAGSVGSQTLLGIPRLVDLRAGFGEALRVWPFETGAALPPRPQGNGRVVLAEVYPSLRPVELRAGEVKDQAQVRTLAEHFAGLTPEALRALFEVPAQLEAADREAVLMEEGWVLGVELVERPRALTHSAPRARAARRRRRR